MDPKIKIISGKNMIDEEIKQPSPTKGKRKARSASPSMEHIAKKRFSQDPLIEHEFVTITCSTPFIIPKKQYIMDIKLQPPQKFMLTDKRFVYYLRPLILLLNMKK